MKKIKILLMADGNSIHTEKWINGLALNDNFEIYLLTMNPAGVRENISNDHNITEIFKLYLNKIPSTSGNNYQYLLYLPQIKKIIRKVDPDVINTIYLTGYGLMGALAKGKTKLCHFLVGSDIMVTPDKNILYKWVSQYALSKGDFFVSASQTLTKKLKTLYPVADEKLLTQQYGISDDVIDYPIQPKIYDFASNRAWLNTSNIPFMLDIFTRLNYGGTLAMIGDGGEIEREIKDKIKLIPVVRHLGILPYMENIDVVAKSRFYLSLTSSDGASLSLMEAMAVGAIPIVSDIEPNREWIEDGVNGFLIKLGDLEGAVDKFKQILATPEDKLEQMRGVNKTLISERGSFSKNMKRLNDSIIDIISGK